MPLNVHLRSTLESDAGEHDSYLTGASGADLLTLGNAIEEIRREEK